MARGSIASIKEIMGPLDKLLKDSVGNMLRESAGQLLKDSVESLLKDPPARLFLGIDGGQSSTTAIIGEASGRILGSGVGGPCNHATAAEGRAKFTRAINESVGAACRSASLDAAAVRFEVVCGGFSGGPEDKQGLLAEILRADRYVVTNDAVIALAGATAGEPGIIVIAGTGSIAFGRNAEGRSMRAGGWGFVFGDEGGGFDLARQGLRAALRQEEGWGPATRLHALYLEAGGAKSANELLHSFYTPDFPRPRIATFSAIVERAAGEGDQVAQGILLKAASDLALLAGAVRRQLFREGEEVRVAHMGGAFRSAPLRDQFKTLVEQEGGAKCGPPLYAPAAGALLEAYRAAGLAPKLTNIPDVKR
jgi:N-acetylglucosamine kinase-like BadF-type ATPase